MKDHKKQAEEIVELFRHHVYCYLGSGMLTNDVDENVQTKEAIACAIIYVKGIIEQCQRIKFQFDISYSGHFPTNTIIKNWQEVLTELKSM